MNICHIWFDNTFIRSWFIGHHQRAPLFNPPHSTCLKHHFISHNAPCQLPVYETMANEISTVTSSSLSTAEIHRALAAVFHTIKDDWEGEIFMPICLCRKNKAPLDCHVYMSQDICKYFGARGAIYKVSKVLL